MFNTFLTGVQSICSKLWSLIEVETAMQQPEQIIMNSMNQEMPLNNNAEITGSAINGPSNIEEQSKIQQAYQEGLQQGVENAQKGSLQQHIITGVDFSGYAEPRLK